ncbi:MAG: 2-oxoglutarate dehydrogenase E1 component [Phycisphaerales bacterium]|nr:2-oxoglutarate dehydrogenase E1 component [Phycisphaerae bacterium]NNF45105.1 2-oxoglutarate dehydrogenase E1 component [Phycisphaerales bacterium]NNM26262.1 2-oxoglutarate dehydrogenase E1 component [Phycisphaerales bacterium]
MTQPPPGADQSINGWNGPYLDAMYERWQKDPSTLDDRWRTFFQGFDLAVQRPPLAADGGAPALPAAGAMVAHTKQGKVDSLVYHYRDIGHLAAELDPLGSVRPHPEYLELASFGLAESDLDETFDPGHLPLSNPASLRTIIDLLRDTYCRHVGVEYMHIQHRERRRWLQERMESVRNQPPFPTPEKMRILGELIEADGFENFLHTRYRGKKRFGLDGGETLIPMLDELAEFGPDHGVEEYTLAMAHRGRLNVLVNILRKTYDQIFTEFEEAWTEDFIEGGGDVKYHRGYSGDFTTSDGQNIRMTLSPNPSHLEFANSVVLGRARAKQRLRRDVEREQCVPILIHGDASFPGQGIVAECLNMMRLDGYTVGGALHIVVNNQIGFTTNPSDAHSGIYCTDLAKMVEAPIFHVNGDDPEACVFATRLAIAYRQRFKNDVVLDLWCYRRHGHNEGDEPTFTQPLLYEKIKNHPRVVHLYAKQLIDEGVISQTQFDELYQKHRDEMDAAQTRTKAKPVATSVKAFNSVWSGLAEQYSDEPVETGVKRETLLQVARAMGTVPEGFQVHRKIDRLMQGRRTAVEEDRPLDWAIGETLAYGTLLLEDHAVRLTGQDVERGTFSHRHAVVFDQETGAGHEPLNHIAEKQSKFCIHNSPLTESACLGFEYGYSLGHPQMLVIWEAQFGDFANGAQVIFDQFIASAEAKWRRFSGLTCFLPHGYEGQGPEHSSARLERFLQLCAKDNMQVVYPTTPAQFFHVLRRQMKRRFRKPLILMTPKSLLRHPKAVSSVEELVSDRFHHVLDDPQVTDPAAIRRLLFCSGKVYYDLTAHREKVGCRDVAIVRVEQLYPFRVASVEPVLKRYAAAADVLWVQEEPRNMGAYRHVEAILRERFDLDVHYVGREPNSTPAVASMKMHQQEQERIMISAIGLSSDDASVVASPPETATSS